MEVNDYWELDDNTSVAPRAPDTDQTEWDIPSNPGYKDYSKSIVLGHPVQNKNKDLNDMSSEQMQTYLSNVYDQRIYEDEEGMKYQMPGSDGQRMYLKDQNQPTGFVYGGETKTNDDIVKFGYAKHGVWGRYAPINEWQRYDQNGQDYGANAGRQGRPVLKGLSEGFPSGPEGIDAPNAFMNWELPEDLAHDTEKLIHGNYGDISSRMMFKDGSLHGKKAYEAFGSGGTEYYDKNQMGLMNDTSVVDTSRVDDRDDIRRKEQAFQDSLPDVGSIPTEMGGEMVGNVSDYWEEDPSMLEQAGTLLKNSLPAPVKWAVDSAMETANDAYDSGAKVGKQVSEHGAMPALRDAGRGLTSGMYDSANVLSNVGGVVQNVIDAPTYAYDALVGNEHPQNRFFDVADKADEIADRIRASNEIPDSEVERLGELASEGVVGGKIGGKIIGTIGKKVDSAIKKSFDDIADLEKRAMKKANKAGAEAMKSGKSQLEAQIVRQKVYDNLVKPDSKKPVLFDVDAIRTTFSDAKEILKQSDDVVEKSNIYNKFRKTSKVQSPSATASALWSKGSDRIKDKDTVLKNALGLSKDDTHLFYPDAPSNNPEWYVNTKNVPVRKTYYEFDVNPPIYKPKAPTTAYGKIKAKAKDKAEKIVEVTEPKVSKLEDALARVFLNGKKYTKPKNWFEAMSGPKLVPKIRPSDPGLDPLLPLAYRKPIVPKASPEEFPNLLDRAVDNVKIDLGIGAKNALSKKNQWLEEMFENGYDLDTAETLLERKIAETMKFGKPSGTVGSVVGAGLTLHNNE